ncbi:MAG: hypothetical protein ACI8R0_003031 [Alteromonadales bacterium]|jgi:hypothetical protein|tara:strand:- start:2 stop:106 length:105 start_codon:yes stop_codon:yes gene_type:complete
MLNVGVAFFDKKRVAKAVETTEKASCKDNLAKQP